MIDSELNTTKMVLHLPLILAVAKAVFGQLLLQTSLNPPIGTSAVIDPSFAGFGIEPSNLFSFMGYASPNQLTTNLLGNLVKYAGRPPHVRIGGNTQDYMIFSENQTEWTWINNPERVREDVLDSSMLIGPHFYDAINRLPAGTPVTYGLNMAYKEDDYVDIITTLAAEAIRGLNEVDLVSFEIGNEPDLWLQNGFRKGDWGGKVYTQEWLDRARVLCEQVLNQHSIPCNIFEPAATANTINTDFQIRDLVEFGIDQKIQGSGSSFIRNWNQHDYYYFVDVSTYTLTLDHLLTFSTTREQFAAWEDQVEQSRETQYPYALREMGLVGPAGMEGITNTFAAALWTLNFFFYAASLNITHVGMHMTDNSNASAWQPIEMYGRQPFVRPLYYAYVAFDQIIGPSCGGRVYSHMRDLSESLSEYNGRVEVYSIYQQDQFSSVVIINGADTSMTLNLSIPAQFVGEQLHLAKLTNEGGAKMTAGTLFNGLSFDNDGLPDQVGPVDQSTTVDSAGYVSLVVRGSEALVAQVRNPVGQLPANNDACSKLSQLPKPASPHAANPNSVTNSSPTDNNSTKSIRCPRRLLLLITSMISVLVW